MIILYDPLGKNFDQLYYNINYQFNKDSNKLIINNPKINDSNKNILKKSDVNSDNFIQLEIEIKNLISKYTNLNLNNNINNKKYKYDKNISYFEDKLKKGYNYRCYPNHPFGNNLLLYIRNYLISINKNKKFPEYPKYITKNNNNIENEKRYFRNIAKNYIIDDENNLYFKYYKNKNDKNNYEFKEDHL